MDVATESPRPTDESANVLDPLFIDETKQNKNEVCISNCFLVLMLTTHIILPIEEGAYFI